MYQECSRACGDSCSDALNCDDAIDGPGLRTCVPGCQCPPGLVQDNEGQCVPISMCPCTQGGKIYQPGAVIQNNCNTWYVDSSSCKENDRTVFKHAHFLLLYLFPAVCFCKCYGSDDLWWYERSDEIILCSGLLIQDRLISLDLFTTQPSACSIFQTNLFMN